METVSPTGSAGLPNFLLEMKKNGYAGATIYAYGRDLCRLSKNCELSNPEAVKEWIASQNLTSTRKWSYVKEYSRYAEFCGITFKKPKYKIVEKLPFIPLEKEVLALIEACESLRESVLFRLLHETGMRVGEAHRLRFKDFDFEKGNVRITPEKGGNSRQVKISDKLCAGVKQVLEKYPDELFPKHSENRRLTSAFLGSESDNVKLLPQRRQSRIFDSVARALKLNLMRSIHALSSASVPSLLGTL